MTTRAVDCASLIHHPHVLREADHLAIQRCTDRWQRERLRARLRSIFVELIHVDSHAATRREKLQLLNT